MMNTTVTNISEGGKLIQGSRRNFHHNTGRGNPRYFSSGRSTVWHDKTPHKTGASPPGIPNMLDRKIEPQHRAQVNTVTTTNSNKPLNVLSTPASGGSIPSFPQGNGVVDRPSEEILFLNMDYAIGVPLHVFNFVHGLPFSRSIENKVATTTPCCIPCEHYSMQPSTNTMQPFHSVRGPTFVYGFPLDLAAHNSHPLASTLIGAI